MILIAATIVAYKARVPMRTPAAAAGTLPRVLLVADLSEADAEDDACADIIRSVRAAGARGIAVQELNFYSKSDLLTRYRVLTIPTVLILGPNGEIVSRHEGEARETVTAVQTELEKLR